jgi:hypothetical protein
MELVWKLQILPYNYANLNSHSGRSRKIRILGNLPDLSKHFWTSNKFGPISKAVCFLDFEFKLCLGFQFSSKRKVVHNELLYTHEKFGKCWSSRRGHFVFYKRTAVWKIGKQILAGWTV